MITASVPSGKTGAMLLLLAAAAVSVLLGLRLAELDAAEVRVQGQLDQLRGQAAFATLDSMTLPVNRPFTVCNDADDPLTVSAVAAVYWDAQGKLTNFNSAAEDWYTWHVSARQSQKLDLPGAADSPWNGSVVFFAMDLNRQSRNVLISGTSDDLKSGCLHVGGRLSDTP